MHASALLLSIFFSLSLKRRIVDKVVGIVKPKDRVVFFPTIARVEENVNDDVSLLGTTHSYVIPIHGWIYEPDRRAKRRKAFFKVIQTTLRVNHPEEKAILQQRASPFLVDNHRWRRVQVQLGDGSTYTMPPSGKNGHFRGEIRVPADSGLLDSYKGITTIPFQAVLRRRDAQQQFQGAAHLLQNTGLSIISDIDDTVKATNSTATKALLRNTFLEEFREVSGMSELYQSWSESHANDNIAFHYVSSSPWQLYEGLKEFLEKREFPPASYHLKTIRIKDQTILNLFADPVVTKSSTISSLLNQFPQRRIVFVGDAGEKDAQVYAKMAKRYPQQIVAIFIRVLPHQDMQEETKRLEQIFGLEGIDRSLWTLFDDSSIPELQTSF